MLRALLAVLHLVALGIGLGAVWARGRSLSSTIDGAAVRRALAAHGWWQLALVLWLLSGIWRVFAGGARTPVDYAHDSLFWTKMGLLVALLALEVWPTVTLARWRRASGTVGGLASRGTARRVAFLSAVEAVLVLAMVAVSVALAERVLG